MNANKNKNSREIADSYRQYTHVIIADPDKYARDQNEDEDNEEVRICFPNDNGQTDSSRNASGNNSVRK
jgi:hypothetical protein